MWGLYLFMGNRNFITWFESLKSEEQLLVAVLFFLGIYLLAKVLE